MIQFLKTTAWGPSVYVAVLACLPSVAVAGERCPATLTAKELQYRLLETHTKIRAWHVEYESERQLSNGEPDRYLHRVVAAKAPDRYYHWSTHGYPSSDWRDDLYQQRLVLAPNRNVVERPAHRQFRWVSIAPDDPLPGSMQGEFLFLALGWWPFPQRPPPSLGGDAPRVVPGIAASPNYVVNPNQELIQGRWCHILEYPGHDRLWLDGDRGCAILAREVFDSDKKVLAQRIESSKHREVKPGIWAPFEFRNMNFDADKSEPKSGKVVKTLDGVLKVLEMRLNEDVQDAMFRFEPQPGSIESIEAARGDRTEHRVPGGSDYLDEVTDWTKRHFRFSAGASSSSDSFAEAVVEYSILGGGIVVLIGLYFRRRKPLGSIPGNVKPANNFTDLKETRT